ncbi:acyl-CoA dehydrogenase family protein [Oryzicola mucosus]|uniref:Acyl-CoA/acyl-ACP dehydrogenase n=1 Tax=Oryzicola mucosus TaxID=2767425 RepID=A0A8J6PH13_9HYPH|nr:acyl-CoA dehydrogenase family protein [Oryzicola mucosus]MBD0413853.1 acyl-CoA/acyl-ACP dehydrogenase [Oryzicola mucosus]
MPQTMFDDEEGTLGMLRESVASFAEQNPGAKALRARRAAETDLDADLWRGMAEAGWLGLLLPEELGGSGLGLAEQAVLSETLGRSLLTEPLAQLVVFSSVLLKRVAESNARTALANGIADGSRIVSPVWQGSDAELSDVSAEPRPDGGYALSGSYHFVSAPHSATDFLAIARSPDGLILVSIDAAADGISVTARPTVDGSRLGHVTLKDVVVSASQVLAKGSAVQAALDEAIEVTRFALAAELAGIASRALEIAVAYTRDRVQFGKPIASFQAVQHRLVDMWGDAEFACAAVVNAADAARDETARATSLAILAAKARAGDAAVSVTRRAVHLHGAMGFTDECDIGLYLKRAINLNATLGQPEVLRLQFVALERAAA